MRALVTLGVGLLLLGILAGCTPDQLTVRTAGVAGGLESSGTLRFMLLMPSETASWTALEIPLDIPKSGVQMVTETGKNVTVTDRDLMLDELDQPLELTVQRRRGALRLISARALGGNGAELNPIPWDPPPGWDPQRLWVADEPVTTRRTQRGAASMHVKTRFGDDALLGSVRLSSDSTTLGVRGSRVTWLVFDERTVISGSTVPTEVLWMRLTAGQELQGNATVKYSQRGRTGLFRVDHIDFNPELN